MTPLVISILCLTMVGTSFLSGIFGMAGGMILVGMLLAMMPVPEAMMLHGVTQMASNGWRGLLWWQACALERDGGLSRPAARSRWCVWSFWRYVPSKPVALLLLGGHTVSGAAGAEALRPNPESIVRARSTAWSA